MPMNNIANVTQSNNRYFSNYFLVTALVLGCTNLLVLLNKI